MNEIDVDIVIIGAGFGGSLAALLAHRIGRSVLLLDRGKHPRFAIGESSTPLANLVLEEFSQRYDLPWLKPFANYASWKAAYPEIPVGLKRGFSYFQHRRGERFRPDSDHHRELLVAASYGPEDADTHWLRSDFDWFLARQVVAAGIPYWDEFELTGGGSSQSGWKLRGQTKSGEQREICPKFVLDATGGNGFLFRTLGLPDQRPTLHTHSRTIFSHFRHVKRWESLYRDAGGHAEEHPYPCDDAALHHVFDGGWMWVLRFDNGVTSAGWCLDPRRFPLDGSPPAVEWQYWMQQFPSIAEQFASAEPLWGDHFGFSGRLQRRVGRAAGKDWALLPTAAGFIDPLHSTGNAHTLIGLERLVCAWEEDWDSPRLGTRMEQYDAKVQAEIEFIDRIVAASYAGFADFDRMVAVTMFYFATAIWSEYERRAGRPPGAFLFADDEHFRSALSIAGNAVSDPTISTSDLESLVSRTFADINLAGLGDPSRRRMYPYPKPQ